MASQLITDLYVGGNLSAKSFNAPASSITDQAVAGGAGIQASKCQQQFTKTYGQVTGSAAATERRPVHSVYGATGQVVQFRAAAAVANIGAATIAIQLKKNGANILTAAITLGSGTAAYVFVAAAGFTSTSLLANDVLEVDVTATAGGGTLGQGLVCELVTREDAQ
jgi:hypothetical protein